VWQVIAGGSCGGCFSRLDRSVDAEGPGEKHFPRKERNGMANILVVDDDPDVVQYVKVVLEKEGHVVSSAGDRESGMAAVQAEKPDLLILDVMMELPDDGFAMAQELRRKGVGVPILMLTSISKVTGLEYGKDEDVVPVDDFQEKPINPASLVAKVGAILKGKGA